MKLSSLERTDLLLLLMYSRGKSGKINEPIVGITRLMKLLFLLSKEEKIEQFNFEAYKMGPFSSEVYPEIDFLKSYPSPENPLVISESSNSISDLSPENFRIISESSEDDPSVAEEINKPFHLSEIGEKLAYELWKDLDDEDKKRIYGIKSEFGSLTLKDLLRYVYKNYPDMTVNSEIKNQL